jgi:predicted metal-dependent hydrolase
MQPAATNIIHLSGRKVEYQVKRSKTARRLRVRVGLRGIQVIRPSARPDDDVTAFLNQNQDWILRALDGAGQLQTVVKQLNNDRRTILFRGQVTTIYIANSLSKAGPNKVALEHGEIHITRSVGSRTTPIRSLENWLRKQARLALQNHLTSILPRVRRQPGKIYVMEQRTKWGNCSALGNLSFNWRLIMAPDFVLRYLVTHEAVHLAIPDHSQRFWLTVQSLCPETERARQWLVANAHRLLTPLPL